MVITRGVKDKLARYGSNLPVDKRTRGYAKLLKDNKWTDAQYVAYLKETVQGLKKKEDKKIKTIIKEVQNEKIKEEVSKKVVVRNKKVPARITKVLQKNIKQRNQLFTMKPTDSSFKSYEKYSVKNPIPPKKIKSIIGEDIVLDITEEEVRRVLNYLKVAEYLKTKTGFKVWLSVGFLGWNMKENKEYEEGMSEDIYVGTQSRVIYTTTDISSIIDDVIINFNKARETSYIKLYSLFKIDIHVAKVNALTASSYIELPDKIANKKAVINIKNEDNLCFVYSVLCGLKTPEKDANRVSKYKDRMNELKYKPEDMPMDINKIIHFEKRNNLRISVFGLEGKTYEIVPLYVSSNKTNTDYPQIQLLYYKPEGTEGHYCYIKDFNRLSSTQTSSTTKNTHTQNLVCPICCEFTAKGGSAKCTMAKHMDYCISGQKVEMPKDDTIKFRHYNNINECPIRIYGDFETLNDLSMKHKSKNGKTTFKTGHKPASFEIIVVSDIYIEGYTKVEDYYITTYKNEGLDSANVFINKISQLEEQLGEIIQEAQYQNKFKIIMTEQQKEEHKSCKSCWICKNHFTTDNKKVKHHNHNTGNYHSALCTNCNIQIKDKVKIPVIFHNLNYDKNVFFTSLVEWYEKKENVKVSILPNNGQNFKSFNVGRLNFIDSMAFMASGLARLIENVPDDNKLFLKHISKNDEVFELMKKKGQFPYEWFDDIEKLKLPIGELKREYFDNELTLSKLNDKEWEDILYIIEKLDIKTFQEYHDFYLNIDVYGLADVFENFRKTTLEYYKLEPCNYVGAPSLAWDAMLLMTGVELDLLKDSDMYLFFERGIRGGQSVIFNKYAAANNKYMEDYDEDMDNTFISYLDANNLYGHAMNRPLPYKDFKWVDSISIDTIMNYDENSDIGYTLEVDLHYPKELHDLHNDYPLAPERYKPEGSFCEKLCGTFYDKKDYIIDIRNLRFYLEKGLVLNKINRVVEYKQRKWLKEYIDLNTSLRTKAKNDFEKDYFKLMNNSVFGKTMENVRGRIQVECCFNDERQKHLQSKTTFKSTTPYHNGDNTFSIVELSKKIVKLDKPIYAGFTILDLSKLHMYDFHYNIMKPKYGENIQLLMTDTDSFVYQIKTDDFYEDMKGMKEHYDMSEYSKDSGLYDGENKKVIGKFKDESPDEVIESFVGIRSKCYSFITKNNTVKKAKGVSKVVVKKNITFDDYKNCVLNDTPKRVKINAIRTLKLTNYSLTQDKLALSNKDDKRVWFDKTSSRAYGHFRN